MDYNIKFGQSANDDLNYYEITESQIVKILAVGHKEHNELFGRGRKVEI